MNCNVQEMQPAEFDGWNINFTTDNTTYVDCYMYQRQIGLQAGQTISAEPISNHNGSTQETRDYLLSMAKEVIKSMRK